LDVIATLSDPEHPTGPLGALGPLPTRHSRIVHRVDLQTKPFGLTDQNIIDLLQGLTTKQVAVVIAGTGSGKSTFLPFRLLYPPAGAPMHLAARGPIVVTEPRQEATSETAKKVADLAGYPPGPGSPIGYRHGADRDDHIAQVNRLTFVTDGTLVNWIRQGLLPELGAIVIDEAHERNARIDLILAKMRSELPRIPHLRLIIASATIDPDVFVDYFGGAEAVYRLPIAGVTKPFGYGHPLWPCEKIDPDAPEWRHDHWLTSQAKADVLTHSTLRVVQQPLAKERWKKEMPAMAARQVLRILDGTPDGDILVFMPGKNEIAETERQIRTARALRSSERVISYLRDAADTVKREVTAPHRPGHRRVVIATNIAETSLTIDGLRYVVDSGLINEDTWNPELAVGRVRTRIHSKQGVRQRWGRVGRDGPGFVFPLYTHQQFDDLFPEMTVPEIARGSMEPYLLNAAAFGLNVDDLSLVLPTGAGDKAEAAVHVELDRARGALRKQAALDEDGVITHLGKTILEVPNPDQMAALELGDRLACAIETATALSLLTLEGRSADQERSAVVGGLIPFHTDFPATVRLEASLRHAALRQGCVDDLDFALHLFSAWEHCDPSERAEWARRTWVDHERLLEADQRRGRLLGRLTAGTRYRDIPRPVHVELAPRVRNVLAASMVDHIFEFRAGSWRNVGLLPSGDDVTCIPTAVQPEEGTRALALYHVERRETLIIGNLILSPDGDGDTSWANLVLANASQLRGPNGRPLGPAQALWDRAHLAWPVGAVVTATLTGEHSDRGVEVVLPTVVTPPAYPPRIEHSSTTSALTEIQGSHDEAEVREDAGPAGDGSVAEGI
jgi:hypothetical protein